MHEHTYTHFHAYGAYTLQWPKKNATKNTSISPLSQTFVKSNIANSSFLLCTISCSYPSFCCTSCLNHSTFTCFLPTCRPGNTKKRSCDLNHVASLLQVRSIFTNMIAMVRVYLSFPKHAVLLPAPNLKSTPMLLPAQNASTTCPQVSGPRPLFTHL
jgi:hypothetical protein